MLCGSALIYRGRNTMPQLTQGLIIAGLIALMLAIIVGYYLRQGQVNELTEALQQSQKRQDELAQEHEQRPAGGYAAAAKRLRNSAD
jgi:uncharacterized protein HemX